MTGAALLDPRSCKAPLIAKLARFIELSGAEEDYLLQMQSSFSRVQHGVDIITAGHTYRSMFILSDGTAIRYKVLHNGRRQILSLVLPGDLIGFPGCLFNNALYSIASVGSAMVCPITFDSIFALVKCHPRLAIALMWMVGHDSALFAEHLIGVGRQSAYERVAHLLLELLMRLQLAGRADERSYMLPMTQEMMADTLGLSVPHVNRMLRRLREDGLISIRDNRLTCLDLPTLSRLADFDGANFAKHKISGI